MLTTNEFLDAVKARHGIPSDYKLGLVLGLTDAAVSHYRKGRSLLDDKVAVKVAELLGVDAGYVVACVHSERAARSGEEDMAAMWEIVAGKFKAAARKLASFAKAAAVLLMVALFAGFWGGGPDGGALASELAPAPFAHSYRASVVPYVKQFLWRLLSWLECTFYIQVPRLA